MAGHLGYEPLAPPEWMQEKFDEGHRLEPIVIEKLRGMGWAIKTEQAEVNANGDHQMEVVLEVIPGKVEVVGHLDGIIEHPSGPMVLEVKTMADKAWQSFKAKGWDDPSPLITKYKWQASCYMLATGTGHYMVAWNKDTEEMVSEEVWQPFFTISDIANRLAEAEEYIEKGLVPEGCKDFPCAYSYLHFSDDSNVESADIELETLMQSWLTWDQAEKAAKKAKDEHREKMLALTGDTAAAKVKGACGVTVETFWQEEKEYTVKQSGKWVTRVSGPRKGYNATGER